MRHGGGAGAVGLALLLVSGCATHRPSGLAARMVWSADGGGNPDLTVDVPTEDAPIGSTAPAAAVSRKARRVVPVIPVMKTSDLPTVETEDVRLASALALLADERSATGHKRVAAEYRRVGVFDRAQHHLTEALVLSPRDGAAYDERARTWRDARDLGRALSDAYRAVYFAPASAGAHNTLGTVLYGLGRVPEARRRFETAASLDPAAAYARSNVCFVAYVEGDLVRAKAECEEALRLAPDLDAARQNQELVAAAMDAARP